MLIELGGSHPDVLLLGVHGRNLVGRARREVSSRDSGGPSYDLRAMTDQNTHRRHADGRVALGMFVRTINQLDQGVPHRGRAITYATTHPTNEPEVSRRKATMLLMALGVSRADLRRDDACGVGFRQLITNFQGSFASLSSPTSREFSYAEETCPSQHSDSFSLRPLGGRV